jgi:hypothetical protein
VGPTRARRFQPPALGAGRRPRLGREGGASWAAPADRPKGERGRAGRAAPPGPGGGGGRGRQAAGPAGLQGERGDFPLLFSSYFPIIYFISNLLLSAYFMESKQIPQKEIDAWPSMMQQPKKNISRVHLHKMSSKFSLEL